MRIKVLMVTDDPVLAVADVQLLKDKEFLVYSCFNTDNLANLISELVPDVLFINPMHSNQHLVETYNNTLNNLSLIKLPVVYTLSEDDVYMVTRKRTIMKKKRTLIADNMLDAIKASLETDTHNIKTPQHKRGND